MNSKTYFIEKQGIYLHGVFWIGSDVNSGVKKLVDLAKKDHDDYHDWYLCLFVKNQCPKSDSEHRCLYRMNKSFDKPQKVSS